MTMEALQSLTTFCLKFTWQSLLELIPILFTRYPHPLNLAYPEYKKNNYYASQDVFHYEIVQKIDKPAASYCKTYPVK